MNYIILHFYKVAEVIDLSHKFLPETCTNIHFSEFSKKFSFGLRLLGTTNFGSIKLKAKTNMLSNKLCNKL